MSKLHSRSISLYILFALILFQGISGVAGGIALVLDPSGASIQIPLDWLQGSPFDTYLIPGLILLIVLGIYPLVLFYALIRKQSWAWQGSVFLGIALIIWILIEILIIGYQPKPPLQLIYGIVGILILVFSLIPSVKRPYSS